MYWENKSYQYIQTHARTKNSGMEFMFVAVYGQQTIHDRLALWEDPRGLAANAQGPILCVGDYHAIMQV